MTAPAAIAASAHALVQRTTGPRGLPLRVEDPVILSRLVTVLLDAARAADEKKAGHGHR